MFRFQPLFPGFESAELVSGGDLTLPEEMEFGSLGRGSSSHRSCFTLRTLFRKSNLIPCALDEEEGEGEEGSRFLRACGLEGRFTLYFRDEVGQSTE